MKQLHDSNGGYKVRLDSDSILHQNAERKLKLH